MVVDLKSSIHAGNMHDCVERLVVIVAKRFESSPICSVRSGTATKEALR